MDKTSQPEKSSWWLAYFIVMVVLYAGSIFVGPHTPVRFLVLIFNGLGLVGLWGYLSDNPIAWRQFWIAYAYLMFLGAAVNFGPGLWHGVRHDSTLFVLLALAAAFSVPGWLAIWRYAFRMSTRLASATGCCLTIHSSRVRFAARLNSGVRRHEET